MVRRKKRGRELHVGGDQISLEERRRQWNINLAERALENLFGEVDLDNDTQIYTSKFKRQGRVRYTPDTLYEKAREYFENISETNENGISIIPDIEDFCLFAQISRRTFLDYRKSDDPAMRDVAESIANAIANCKKQSALQGTINPTIFAIDMNNNHDYVQAKTEVTVSQNISLEQIESNIADIANRLPVDD